MQLRYEGPAHNLILGSQTLHPGDVFEVGEDTDDLDRQQLRALAARGHRFTPVDDEDAINAEVAEAEASPIITVLDPVDTATTADGEHDTFPLAGVGGLNAKAAEALNDMGITTQEALLALSDKDLQAVPGLGRATLRNLRALGEDGAPKQIKSRRVTPKETAPTAPAQAEDAPAEEPIAPAGDGETVQP